ncbi:uncharacterized protein LOC144906833 isoform X2 [Branchiostoma floridae x Branchiostoma belcheri]|nr:Protein SPT2 [Branchiostoma belcheri]
MEWAHILLLCGTVGLLLSSSSAVPPGKPTGSPSLPPPVVSLGNKPAADGNKSGWQDIQDAYFALSSIREQLDQAREQLQEAYDNNDYEAARRLAQRIRDLQEELQEAYNNLTALTG